MDLPDFGRRVRALTAAGLVFILFRRKMPRGGWTWASDHIRFNIRQADVVAWEPLENR